jgi:hypothetical protein
MKKQELALALIFGFITVMSWFFPIIELVFKFLITAVILCLIALIIFRDNLAYFFRKFWLEITAVSIIAISSLLIWKTFPDSFIPLEIIFLTCISITILVNLKYNQKQVFKNRSLLRTIKIDNAWALNHWGGDCASIESDRMIFKGKKAPLGNEGSHTDLKNFLDYGLSYAIRCYAKSTQGTTGYFQLWCHDNIGAPIHGVEIATEFKRPSLKGEYIELIFKPLFNNDLRIHLQYSPGEGSIEVNHVEIYKLK